MDKSVKGTKPSFPQGMTSFSAKVRCTSSVQSKAKHKKCLQKAHKTKYGLNKYENKQSKKDGFAYQIEVEDLEMEANGGIRGTRNKLHSCKSWRAMELERENEGNKKCSGESKDEERLGVRPVLELARSWRIVVRAESTNDSLEKDGTVSRYPIAELSDFICAAQMAKEANFLHHKELPREDIEFSSHRKVMQNSPRGYEKALEKSNGEPSLDVQKYVLEQCRKWNFVWVEKNKVAPVEPDEMEIVMGFPRNHTRGVSRIKDTKRLATLFRLCSLVALTSFRFSLELAWDSSKGRKRSFCREIRDMSNHYPLLMRTNEPKRQSNSH
ncbi:hypothetical protein HYC85_021418 [Camellia sinensis]|uniref:SAM-dependent MTase DRM-type domain-containing protein n=1 Tax=Camellia sinensis TaxID=4442 RepID=A0A7J7GK35_CAMSI|nr:hypothetical protein HYC85_021418 [Camellia sinensis]